ncbi:hypothetical protein D3A96_07880 [Robertkochia marina]|nr:hypothetical protein D3A96_07880 [Robertkochia marina]
MLLRLVNTFSPIEIEGAYDVHSFEVKRVENTDYFDTQRWNQVVVNRSLNATSNYGHVLLGTSKGSL